MNKKYSVNFHQTFQMNLQYLSYILNLNEEALTKYEISELTGIPTGERSGKVEPHIKYAEYCNLLNYKLEKNTYVLEKTLLGELINKNDMYFNEEITRELLLYFITSKSIGADQWYYLIREILSEVSLSVEYINKSMQERYPNIKRIKNNIVIKTINELDSNIVCEMENKYIYKKTKRARRDYKFAYAYTLLFEIEKKYNNIRTEITYDELEELKWKEGHFFTIEDEFKVLEWLETSGIIKLNKQLSPITIIKLKKSEEILKLIYSDLL